MTPWQHAEIVSALEKQFGPYESLELISALKRALNPGPDPWELLREIIEHRNCVHAAKLCANVATARADRKVAKSMMYDSIGSLLESIDGARTALKQHDAERKSNG